MKIETYAMEISPVSISPGIRGLYRNHNFPIITFLKWQELAGKDMEDCIAATELKGHVVPEQQTISDIYAKLRDVVIKGSDVDFIIIAKMGAFFIGQSKQDAERKKEVFLKRESYRNLATKDLLSTRLKGRVVVITGGARGFGGGIAEVLAENGAHLILADIDEESAKHKALQLCETYGQGMAAACFCDVSKESSVKDLCEWVVREYGGIDVMLSNAGISRAGGLEAMTTELFERITRINYTAYFFVTKYASRSMKLQSFFDDNFSADIIQTNSKAGLKGWIKNFAYCGSKFGGIGLTESFSRELVEYGIKVNAVCPGNYYDGPMWGDPEKGLFVEYFKAGKVKGAKGPEDVRKWYFDQELFGRGCLPSDVAKAVMYCIEQCYETGQAIPVAGGLEMLK